MVHMFVSVIVAGRFLQIANAEPGVLDDYNQTGCKSISYIDGEEVVRPCTAYEHSDFIKHKRAFGRIVTSSGGELRQYPELTRWLANEEHLAYHNLDLEIVRRREPTLQVLDSKSKRVIDEFPLGEKYTSQAALESLLASLDFEKNYERSEF